jgi:hypothetical protein
MVTNAVASLEHQAKTVKSTSMNATPTPVGMERRASTALIGKDFQPYVDDIMHKVFSISHYKASF